MHIKLKDRDTIRHYISEKLNIDFLRQDEEYQLVEEWKRTQNKESLEKLIIAHKRLIKHLANKYTGYGLAMDDLISEGYIGVIQAASKFEIDRGFRFYTYAYRCIKTLMQKAVMRLSKSTSIASSNDNKKLFFQLKRLRRDLGNVDGTITEENLNTISKDLGISKSQIDDLDRYLSSGSFSLNHKINDDNNIEVQDMLSDPLDLEGSIINKNDLDFKIKLLKKSLEILNAKEYKIFCSRRLADPPKLLSEIASEFQVTPERIRQIEKNAFLKIAKHIKILFYEKDGRLCISIVLF